MFLIFVVAHLVVNGQEWRRGFLVQQGQVDALGVSESEVPLNAAVNGVEITPRGENEIATVAAEARRVRVVPLVGNGVFPVLPDVVEIDNAHVVTLHSIVGEPLTVGREMWRGNFPQRVLEQGGLCLCAHIHEYHAVLSVGVNDAVAGGAPSEVADVSVVVAGELDGFAALCRPHPQLGFAGLVTDVGNVLSVRAPLCAALMHSRGVGDISCDTFFYRYVKHLSAGRDDDAVSVGRQVSVGDIRFELAQVAPCHIVLAIELDSDFPCLLGGGVQAIDIAAVLKDNHAASARGEFHVIIGEMRHLVGGAGSDVVDENVHRLVAVAHEIDFVAYPHG